MIACFKTLCATGAWILSVFTLHATAYYVNGTSGAVVNLVSSMVKTIGVHDGNAKGRLLGMSWISNAFKNKISIRGEWYF